MKTRNLFILTLITLAVLQPVNAQVKYYKIQDGAKTLLKEAEQITIPLNDKMESNVNILMEVDMVAFKKTYTYQQITSTLNYNSNGKAYIKDNIYWNIESDLFKAKYGADKTLSYYLLGTAEVLKNPKNMYYYKGSITLDNADDTVYFDIEAAYKTGKEGYFENNAYKERDVFSKREYVPNPKSPIIRYEIPASILLDDKYKSYVNPGYAESKELIGFRNIQRKLEDELRQIKDIKQNVPVVGFVYTFAEVSRAMETIVKSRENQIKNETDKQKALDLLAVWNKDYTFLLVLEKSETPTLKALNKKMKGISDENALMDLFKNYTGK
ncbi:MAG: hypothetical protein V4622_09970 [Bacteroidota bacterium]